MITPAELIEQTRVPGTRSVFFLGCFERRVTVYSQQVRAINLVAAILDQSLVRQNGKVAIVGGGAAGLTAAVALARGAPGLRAIHVYEKLPEVLQLQQSSGRYLHPHNYDWPADGWDQTTAGLPFMNWRAGLARDIQRHLREAFDAEARASAIELRVNTAVSGVTPFPHTSARVVLGSGGFVPETYDVVILSVGFGIERTISGATPSYWTVSELESPILAPGIQSIFISGNGDGGLVDFMSAAFIPMTHQHICELLMGFDMPGAKAELALIEQEAWTPGATVDIFEAYRTRVMPLVPANVLADVGDRLRRNVMVRLHTNEPYLFKRDSAVLNRFGCALLLHADQNFGNAALSTTVGVPFDGLLPLEGPVALAGEMPFQPFRRYLRLGPDSAANLQPFQALRDLMPLNAGAPPTAYRPATPELSLAAIARFGVTPGPDGPEVVVAGIAAEGALNLRLDLAANGDLIVSCDLLPSELGQAWRSSRQVSVDCAFGPAFAPGVLEVLARLCGHAAGNVIYAADRRQWEELLHHAVRGRAMPGDAGLQFRVEPARALGAAEHVHVLPPEIFAAEVQTALDAESFRELHELLFDVLARPDPAECGWVIEHHLRTELWALWQTWRAMLQDAPQAQRRFMLLLADPDDFTDSADASLVRVGPRTTRRHLLRATLFALAFVLGAGRSLAPAEGRPGNLEGEGLSGHACGVTWIEGRDVGPRVAERTWSASLVLLAELKVAAALLFVETRLDAGLRDRPRIGDVAISEGPLILGADEAFLDALEAGRTALNAYLEDVITARAAAASSLIEDET